MFYFRLILKWFLLGIWEKISQATLYVHRVDHSSFKRPKSPNCLRHLQLDHVSLKKIIGLLHFFFALVHELLQFCQELLQKKVRTLVALPQKHFLYTVKVRKSSDVLLACIIRIGEVGGCYSKLHVSESTQRKVCVCYSVCKNIHREKVSASDDYVTLGHVFPKVYYHHESSQNMYCFSDTAIFNFQLFFFEHNHNNRK